MHCLAWRIVASAAARHTESGRRRTTGFTASLRSSRLFGLFRCTWEFRWQEKSGGSSLGSTPATGVSRLGSSSDAMVDFHKNVMAYVDSGWGPMPKAVPGVYRNHPRSLEDLKDAVKPVARRLPLSVCRAAAEATIRRAKQCIERNGGNLEHVLGAAQYGDRRLSKSRNPLKQNIFPRNILIRNSSDFLETRYFDFFAAFQ